ncbi:DUF5694 domain-containing protein [Jeotgalibacillus proteolyticus]|uniref:Uncharacterized protein n=1 Tax=Jeotgalibacillus proteolyticus TaxID=2082395 RepID=A0A2S5G607_9BACL|nr:DUF5694 domain-containing protein [Jeotgalibacillus proteolyticus]PPA68418.1 hypothetical protein C4B60_21130 [Jeotgalibacillus proteolyticus]
MSKPTIFVLGTDHFSAEVNGDLFSTDKETILSKNRQKEMIDVVNHLKAFNPTKVALEVEKKNEKALNANYTSYRNGDFTLTINEVHQIGFRLAKECELNKVSAVDWNETEDGIPNLGDWSDTEEFKSSTTIWEEMLPEYNAYLQNHSLKEYLLLLNDTQTRLKGQETYMKLALVGSEANPAGAIWNAKYWYFRNLLIYKNVVSLIDSAEERIFVLYGSGHLHLLLQFLNESNLFNMEAAHDYLK